MNLFLTVIQSHLDGEERAHFERMLADVEPGIRATLAELPEQYIHGDCHGGNILFYWGDVSGFVDFDLLPYGPRIYDVSYLLADRLKSYFEDSTALEVCLQHIEFVINGYDEVRPLTARERGAIWYGMLAVQMIFADWFFTHNVPTAAMMNLAVLTWIYQHKGAIVSRILDQEGSV